MEDGGESEGGAGASCPLPSQLVPNPPVAVSDPPAGRPRRHAAKRKADPDMLNPLGNGARLHVGRPPSCGSCRRDKSKCGFQYCPARLGH